MLQCDSKNVDLAARTCRECSPVTTTRLCGCGCGVGWLGWGHACQQGGGSTTTSETTRLRLGFRFENQRVAYDGLFHDSPVRNTIELKVYVPTTAGRGDDGNDGNGGGGGGGGRVTRVDDDGRGKTVLTDYSPLFPLTPGDKVSDDMLDALNITWAEFGHLLWDPSQPMAAAPGWPHGIPEGGAAVGASKLGAAIRHATRACEVNWWDDWG